MSCRSEARLRMTEDSQNNYQPHFIAIRTPRFHSASILRTALHSRCIISSISLLHSIDVRTRTARPCGDLASVFFNHIVVPKSVLCRHESQQSLALYTSSTLGIAFIDDVNNRRCLFAGSILYIPSRSR